MSLKDESLARFHAALEQALPPADLHPARLHTAMRYAAEGGKRLRALLVYGAGYAAQALPECLDAPAVAVELIHAYSLVHDDLPAMDNDDLRRGRATVHKAFDEATAILAGDALQTLAFDVLVNEAFSAPSPATRLTWMRTLLAGTGSLGMTGGQMLDLEAEHQTINLEQLQLLHRLKTGALIVASVRLGLSAGTADVNQWRALDVFAQSLGLAYQIQDDILDVEGTPESLGKTPGKDQRSNKSTYVKLMGLEAAKQQAAQLFSQAHLALERVGDKAALLKQLLLQIEQRKA